MIPEPTSILAFRNGSIGNTLAAVPALRALRKRYPQATLSVVVDPVGFQLLEHCPWIDHLVVYDKRGRHRSLLAQAALVRDLRKLEPSHAVLFKRFFRNGLLALLSGAAVRAGFRTNGKSPFLTHTVPYEEKVHVVDLDLRLAALLGASSDDWRPEMFLTDGDREQARDLTGNAPYLVAHYGGQTTPPDFVPKERFVHLLRLMAGKDLRVVFIGSGRAETEQAQALAAELSGACAPRDLPLRVTSAVIEGAELFVGFNSGPAHIAAAVGTPELIFFRPDSNTENEVLKWSPVSNCSRTFVPPRSSSDQEWAAFMERVVHSAHELSGIRTTANVG
jgi:ADP-heptose:LPS heptosyltransferase